MARNRNVELQLEYQKRYEKTPKGQYQRHRQNARRRGVSFLLTFDQWWSIWQESGLWDVRGAWAGGAVMMRHRDRGPYAVGNVSIGMHSDNIRERNKLVAAGMRKRHTARATTVLFVEQG